MPGGDKYIFDGRAGNPGLGAQWPYFTTHPQNAPTGFDRIYALGSGRVYKNRAGTLTSFAFEQQANIFTLLNRFKDLQLDDQDGTPVADRVLRNIDGLIRAASTGLVEGRHISKASLEALDTANINNDQITFALMQNITGPCVVGKSGAGAGDPAEISAGADDRVMRRTAGALDFGQLTVGMAPDSLWTYAKLQDAAAVSLLGRSANSAGVLADIAAGANDRVLARTADSLAFQQLSVGMAPANLWTYAKLQQVSATSRFLGRKTPGAGDIEELSAADALAILGITGGDLVFTATAADTSVASVTDVQIVSRDVASVAAGDQLIVEGFMTIFNNSGAARNYHTTIDFDGAFDAEIQTGTLTNSGTDEHPIYFKATLSVRTTSLAYCGVQLEYHTNTPMAGGADTVVSSATFRGTTWGTVGATDLTGTVTVTMHVRSTNATATQTCRLHSFTIRKVTPT